MAFELTDFHRSYVPRGEMRGLFNLARMDTDSQPVFYAYMNEVGSYVIQRYTTSGTLKIVKYYAKRGKPSLDMTAMLDADWANRAALSYVDYFALFDRSG